MGLHRGEIVAAFAQLLTAVHFLLSTSRAGLSDPVEAGLDEGRNRRNGVGRSNRSRLWSGSDEREAAGQAASIRGFTPIAEGLRGKRLIRDPREGIKIGGILRMSNATSSIAGLLITGPLVPSWEGFCTSTGSCWGAKRRRHRE